ncbi:uncharacterized protein EI97DRAFT_8085 [Westerdykella ornata]|uniref:L domain-like protein n=1 Tax=Westerdykella ornata TaxID=318751 RepID=A0A6A6K096_WESOR|nr:uncharacterized protein EI97DRAFT_8085 [Westerdykella ornata]KAF2280769.1 hypothetical protein EI97DRAFT_8085 [Westerdykella ornata]
MMDPDSEKENLPPPEFARTDTASKSEPLPQQDEIASSPPLVPFSEAMSPTSSEPPIFSSDGPEHMDDVENYASPRDKRKRAGPWWEGDSERPSAAKKGRNMERYDSGVVAYSDDVDQFEPVPEAAGSFDEGHKHFVQRLLDCVHANRDYFEYDTGTLEDHHLEQVYLLNQIINPGPDPGTEVPADGQYRSMVPRLKLNFRCNQLCRLHINLFSLENITSLTLRDNNIQELSPQIGQLRNLVSLDLSNNNLFWMPSELHSLLKPHGNLRGFSCGGNCLPWPTPSGFCRLRPFALLKLEDPPTRAECLHNLWERYRAAILLEKEEDVPKEWENYDGSLDKYREDLVWDLSFFEYWEHKYPNFCSYFNRHVLLGCSPVSYFYEHGQLIPGSFNLETLYDVKKRTTDIGSACVVPTSRGLISFPRVHRERTPSPPQSSSAVRTLFSLSLNEALRNESPATIRQFLGAEIPPVIDAALSRAEDNKERLLTTFLTCRCGKSFLIPRAVWFEYWLDLYGPQVPYKVQVCSWACAERFYMKSYLDPEEDPVLGRRDWISRLPMELQREMEEDEDNWSEWRELSGTE